MDNEARALETAEHGLRVKLPAFEGPLDLLLHLIKKNRLNIYDIPIARITGDYLHSLQEMHVINMEVAGHFLEMAATLALIKSQLLIPQAQPDGDPDDEDPRLQVVRPLLLYACMQKAAELLGRRPMLGVNQFVHVRAKELLKEMCGDGSLPPPPLEANLYELFKAYWRLRNRTTQLQAYAITAEQLSVTDRMRELLDLLHGTAGCWLSDLCVPVSNRQLVVVTFLALLEMIKKRMVQIVQESATNDLWVSEVECD